MNIQEKLINIQIALKATKSQYNKFGDFYYRSCEDILEALKPLCNKNQAVVLLSDEIVMIGDRFYTKATASLIDTEGGGDISVTAYAREPLEKRGMDASQVTGTSSSYARKYALNGLFCIDDNKDSDALAGVGLKAETVKAKNLPEPKVNPQDKPKLQDKPKPSDKQEVTDKPTDICFICNKKVPATFSMKQNKELSGAEIVAACNGMCPECYKANVQCYKANVQ